MSKVFAHFLHGRLDTRHRCKNKVGQRGTLNRNCGQTKPDIDRIIINTTQEGGGDIGTSTVVVRPESEQRQRSLGRGDQVGLREVLITRASLVRGQSGFGTWFGNRYVDVFL